MASETELVTLSSTLIKLTPVIIGGVLTILGGFVAAFLTHHLSKKTKKEDFRRNTIEKSARLALAITHWTDEYKNSILFEHANSIGQPPVDELEVVVTFYLPELENEMFNILKAENEYKKWVLRTKQAKLSSGALEDEYIQEYNDIYANLSNQTNEFVNKASSLLK